MFQTYNLATEQSNYSTQQQGVNLSQTSFDKDTEFITKIDFTQIEEMDPSLYDGHRVIFDSELAVEVKLIDDEDEGAFESLKLKVMILGDERQPINIKMEMTSESDIFFLYKNITNEDKFRVIQEQQALSLEFTDFSAMLMKILQNCQKPQTTFITIFTLDNEEKKGYLEFYQDTEFRRVEMLRIEFEEADEDTIKNHITYRLTSIRQKTTLMQERIKDVMAIVEEKNPMLVSEIYKATPSLYVQQR
eukprot:403350037